MSTFATIPCELMISVLRELGNVRFPLPSLLTCRHVYSCFKENPGVAAEILQRQPPAVIPYSIAVLEASHLSPQNETVVHELLETLGVYATIEVYRMSPDHACPASDKNGTYTKWTMTWLPTLPAAHEHVYLRIKDQMTFFELKLSKASHDVLAHDVEFGGLGIDYIMTGDNNHFRQLWLSQGVDFVHNAMSENSYDSKKALLESTFDAGKVDLYDALMLPPETDLNDDTLLSGYADEDLAALFTPTESQDQDTDKGPFEAWRVAFNPWPRTAWVMLINNSGLRERAYVFWDLDRIETYGMLKLFENTPEYS